MCYCLLSGRLSNDCQIARAALVSGPQNWNKPYNKHLISLVFSVSTVNYGPRASCLGHKSMEKNSVRNLQYGPKTRLIRGIYINTISEITLVISYIKMFSSSNLYSFVSCSLKIGSCSLVPLFPKTPGRPSIFIDKMPVWVH